MAVSLSEYWRCTLRAVSQFAKGGASQLPLATFTRLASMADSTLIEVRHSTTSYHQATCTLPSAMMTLRMLENEPGNDGLLEIEPGNDGLHGRIARRLILTTLPTPEEKPGNVIVQIQAVAINPSDAANASGYFAHTTLPRTPGRDWAGVVVSTSHPLSGRRVFGTSGRHMGFTFDGPSAEYCTIPESGLVPMPDTLSFAQAATLGVPWTTAYLMLERANVTKSDRVLVLGASGAVGSAACQLARVKGCQVITAARRAWADIDLSDGVPDFSGESTWSSTSRPSVVFDTTGSPSLMSFGLESLAVGGRLAYISAPKSHAAQFCFDMKTLYRTEKSIIGCNSLQYSIKVMNDILRQLAPDFGTSGKYVPIESGEILGIRMSDAVAMYQKVWERGATHAAETSRGTHKIVIRPFEQEDNAVS